MSIKRIVAANAAPIDAPSTINKLKFNGSSEALKPRLQFKGDRNQNRPELKRSRQGSTIGAGRFKLKLKKKPTKSGRSQLLQAVEAQ